METFQPLSLLSRYYSNYSIVSGIQCLQFVMYTMLLVTWVACYCSFSLIGSTKNFQNGCLLQHKYSGKYIFAWIVICKYVLVQVLGWLPPSFYALSCKHHFFHVNVCRTEWKGFQRLPLEISIFYSNKWLNNCWQASPSSATVQQHNSIWIL